MKFLLIAGYLASHNPAKLDVKYFSSARTRRSRASVKSEVQTQKPNGSWSHLSCSAQSKFPARVHEPKLFTLSRLFAIFLSLMDTQTLLTADHYTQVASLVSLGMFSVASAAGTLDQTKFRCLAGFEFISQLARDVRLELHKYLAE